MTQPGELVTLDRAGLFARLEAQKETGILHLAAGRAGARALVREGRITALAYAGRPRLFEVLIACGASGSVGRVDQVRLREIARARLADELAERLAAEPCEVDFQLGDSTEGFDADELRVALALSPLELLSEVGAKGDAWRKIRRVLSDDEEHWILARTQRSSDGRSEALAAECLRRLDGTRCLREALLVFPTRRFEALSLVAHLVECGDLRRADPEDYARLARAVLRRDRERAKALVTRGLAEAPSQEDLLALRALLAEEVGELETAALALKELVRLNLESGEWQAARRDLARAKNLDPEDLFLWESSLELARREKRVGDAMRDGGELVRLLCKRGERERARAVLAELVELAPTQVGIACQHARLLAEMGERDSGVRALESFARERMRAGDHRAATRATAEILALDPSHDRAASTQTLLGEGERARERHRGQRIGLAAFGLGLGLTLFALGSMEVRARAAYHQALDTILRRGWIEAGRFGEAAAEIEAVGRAHAWSPTAWFDVPATAESLRARSARRDS
jgi:tetratricopeptide (TPR) repeat protein